MTVLRLFNCTLFSLDWEYLHAYVLFFLFFYAPFDAPEIKLNYLLTYIQTGGATLHQIIDASL